MTTQETFKKQVRARMARTGERYTTARQALLAKSSARNRPWASEPEMNNEAVAEATGRDWDTWCDLIDSWPGEAWDHGVVAKRLQADFGLTGWWSQAVTGGYERITGLRLPGQMPDGTFTTYKSKTVTVDVDKLRELLLDDEQRADLFPGEVTELRSRPSSKAIRLRVGPGSASIGLEAKTDGRAKVTIQHEKLPTLDDIERWKFWWAEWLEAIDQG